MYLPHGKSAQLRHYAKAALGRFGKLAPRPDAVLGNDFIRAPFERFDVCCVVDAALHKLIHPPALVLALSATVLVCASRLSSSYSPLWPSSGTALRCDAGLTPRFGLFFTVAGLNESLRYFGEIFRRERRKEPQDFVSTVCAHAGRFLGV